MAQDKKSSKKSTARRRTARKAADRLKGAAPPMPKPEKILHRNFTEEEMRGDDPEPPSPKAPESEKK